MWGRSSQVKSNGLRTLFEEALRFYLVHLPRAVGAEHHMKECCRLEGYV